MNGFRNQGSAEDGGMAFNNDYYASGGRLADGQGSSSSGSRDEANGKSYGKHSHMNSYEKTAS